MKVLMIEGRPSEHPIHRAYAESVGADFIFIDQVLPYQGKDGGKFRMFVSWGLTAVYLLTQRKYKVYFCGGPCPPLTLLKRVGLLSKRKKIISLAANETLFFLKQGKFSAFTMKLYRDWYNHTIDGLICIGDFQQKLACEIIEKNLPIRRIFNGLPEAFFKTAKHFSYNPEGKDLVLIANGPSSFRVYYKGLDLAIKAFCLYCINGASEGRFLIIGDWLQSTQNELLKTLPNHVAERVVFKGRQASFIPYLQNVGLCIHFSRGDSFPTSNLETLALGIPTMITNTTGTVEIVQVINKEWVVPMEVDEMALRIKAHFKLPGYERIRLSRKAKDYMIAYNHNEAIIKFKAAFMEMVNAS